MGICGNPVENYVGILWVYVGILWNSVGIPWDILWESCVNSHLNYVGTGNSIRMRIKIPFPRQPRNSKVIGIIIII